MRGARYISVNNHERSSILILFIGKEHLVGFANSEASQKSLARLYCFVKERKSSTPRNVLEADAINVAVEQQRY